MTLDEIRELEAFLTPEERAELTKLIEQDIAERPWTTLPGPQTQAYNIAVDILGYGGAAGGGKTDLIAGLVLTKHYRCLVVRREKAQTLGVVQRITEILGSTDGYSSQNSVWKIGKGKLCEFAGLDNPGDERRWQGRAHDLKAFDEVTEMREAQVRFVMGWTRTNRADAPGKVLMTFNPPTTSEGRWVIDFFGPWLDKKHPLYPTPPGNIRYAAMLPDGQGGSKDVWLETNAPFVLEGGERVYEFDPAQYKKEDIIAPKSRTFIPAKLTDNPIYMDTGYMSTLQSLPEPLRSQMLYGDFQAGISDDPWQTIPTAWVEAAQARWRPRSPRGEMLTVGVDVARGGKDNTVISTRHQTDDNPWWFDTLHLHPGSETPDGPKVAGLVVAQVRDQAPIAIDVIGVGASPYDVLNSMRFQVVGVNASEKALGTDKSGRLRFLNQRSQLWWAMRELLDPANDMGAALPPDKALLDELCMPKWHVHGSVIQVESKDEIVKRLGRSPDRATAVVLAQLEYPKRHVIQALTGRDEITNHDPFARR